jgi:hypothetical protein
MSALGQKQTCAVRKDLSALPSKADMVLAAPTLPPWVARLTAHVWARKRYDARTHAS